MENLLIVFIAVTAIAVVLQAAVLVAMFVTLKASVSKMEAVVDDMKAKTLPSIEAINKMVTQLQPRVEQIADNLVQLHPKILQIVDNVTELKPKVQTIVENLADTTATVRAEVQRVDAAVNDVVDRARLQVIRADEMLTRTFDRVEHTSDLVTKTVVSPVRQVSGIFRGVTAGVEFFLGNRGRKNGNNSEDRGPRRAVPQDEMFI
jgi:methyl-accepting chemotaxis protein